MTTSRLFAGLLLGAVLAAQGCAYQTAMRKGDRAAQRSDWPAAYNHYSDAFEANSTPEAGEEMKVARAKTVEQADRTIRAALEAGDWDVIGKTWALMREVAGEDEVAVHDLKKEISAGLVADVQELIASGKAEEAYEISLASTERFPGELFPESALDKVRYHYRSIAEAAAAEGRFEEANAALEAITSREPDRAEILARQRATMETGWAEQLVNTGQDLAKKGKPGTAAVHFARAYELVRKSESMQRAQDLARESSKKAGLGVYSTYDGQWSRRKALQESLEKLLDDVEGASIVPRTQAHLSLALSVGEASCTEAKETKRVDREYVSGQRDVANEPYVAIETQLTEALAAQKQAQAEVDALEGPYGEQSKKLQAMTEGVDEAQKNKDNAQRQLKRAEKNLAEQKALVDKLEAQAEAATDAEERAALNTKVSAIANNAMEWEQEVTRWQAEFDTANGALASAQSERNPVADAHRTLRTEYQAATSTLEAASERVTELNRAASQTAQTVKEDIVEVFSFDEHTWTRTCTAALSATRAIGWESKVDKKLNLEATKTEIDKAHVGHRASRLSEDPKGFVQDKEDLIGDADAENMATFKKWLSDLANEYYATRIAELKAALESGDAEATEAAVGLYMAAPGFLGPEGTALIESFLLETYRLEKPAALRDDLSAAPPPPEIDDF